MSTRRQTLITVSLCFLVGHLLFPKGSVAEDPIANAFDAYLASVPDGQAPFSFDRSDYDCSADQRAGLPIGVFDSGVGGLTVLEAIITSDLFDNETLKPGPDGRPDFQREKFIYLGDQANMPYGNYSREDKTEYLRELILKDATFLLGRRHRTSAAAKPRFDKPPVKAIVIACNTATAYGLDIESAFVQLRRDPSFEPFVAESRHYIDPAVWTARELFVELARRRIRATSKTSPSIETDAVGAKLNGQKAAVIRLCEH